MCTPVVFRSVNQCSAAREKYRKEAWSSEELCLLIRSGEGGWMLKSLTTRVGKEVAGRARVGETVLSVAVEPHTL